MAERKISRRMLLVATALNGAGVLGLELSAAQGFTKSPQQSAGYQDRPSGAQRCDNCMHFQPPAACKVVAGRISPAGWCRIYAAKSR